MLSPPFAAEYSDYALAILAIALTLSYFSYHYIESPFLSYKYKAATISNPRMLQKSPTKAMPFGIENEQGPSRGGDVLESRAYRADRGTWFYAGSVVVIENYSGQKYCEVKLWRRKAPSAGRKTIRRLIRSRFD